MDNCKKPELPASGKMQAKAAMEILLCKFDGSRGDERLQ
jgi:hypothetical protein